MLLFVYTLYLITISRLLLRLGLKWLLNFHFLSTGLTLGVTVVEGNFAHMYAEAQAAKVSIRQCINEEGVKGFPDVVVSNNISDGICHL